MNCVFKTKEVGGLKPNGSICVYIHVYIFFNFGYFPLLLYRVFLLMRWMQFRNDNDYWICLTPETLEKTFREFAVKLTIPKSISCHNMHTFSSWFTNMFYVAVVKQYQIVELEIFKLKQFYTYLSVFITVTILIRC